MYYSRHSLLGQSSFMVPATENLSPIPASIDTNDIPLIANDLKLLETQAKLINILQDVPFYLPVNLTKIESLLETLTMGVSNTVDLYFHDNEVERMERHFKFYQYHCLYKFFPFCSKRILFVHGSSAFF